MAYIEAGKQLCIMPETTRKLKHMRIFDDCVMYGMIIQRQKMFNGGYMLTGIDSLFKCRLSDTVSIPPSIEYVYTDFPVNVPSTVKYLLIETISDPFTINTELEYLWTYYIYCDNLKTTKPIKFLCVGCLYCLYSLPGILPYVKYVINRNHCRNYHDVNHTTISCPILEGIFTERIEDVSMLHCNNIYTFKEVNSYDCIEYIRYLF
jgi:hypothetical protein